MAFTNEREFMAEQERALERMREMKRRATPPEHPHTMPPTPGFVSVERQQKHNSSQVMQPQKIEFKGAQGRLSAESAKRESQLKNSFSAAIGGINIPFLGRIGDDPDMTLLLGILLILASENADRYLLMALLYILI